MKVLMLNGSNRENGCTFTALTEIGKQLEKEGIEYEIYQLGQKAILDCIGCGSCGKTRKCVFTENDVNEFTEKAKDFDGFIFGTPVYYAHPSGRIQSFLDRAFYSSAESFRFKPGASVASARRAGTSASLDVLNKYFTISSMPNIGSSYWNMVHGNKPEEVAQDLEGLQTMRNLAKNMAWILRCIELGKQNGIVAPEMDRSNRTNFIR